VLGRLELLLPEDLDVVTPTPGFIDVPELLPVPVIPPLGLYVAWPLSTSPLFVTCAAFVGTLGKDVPVGVFIFSAIVFQLNPKLGNLLSFVALFLLIIQ
jgi:hypothetical protein